jgi:protein-L-isoaspartate(D-aspartate) O-methyltransferase
MDRHVIDYTDARNMMVDGQVRPNKVADRRVLDAMRRIPRELFLPDRLRSLAYVDEDVPLGNGRVLMEPMVIARVVQLAAPRAGERALVVASGAGYGAALLAACGVEVTALEENPELLDIARRALSAVAPEVRLVAGPLRDGDRAGAPWDLILIEGAVEEIPAAIAGQLRPGGRLVTVLGANERVGQAVLAELVNGGLSFRPVFDCATPLIPAMRKEPGFVF